MKTLYTILISTALCAAASVSRANQPVDARLDYVANNLVFASQQLVNGIRAAQGDSHIEQDAETLYDAAEHFKEEVELGPIDLDVDFNTLSQVYDEMRNELANSLVVQNNSQVRTCWFNTQEAFISLRQAWLEHSGGTVTPPPPVTSTITVDCGSSRYQYKECPVAGRIVGINLMQQLSHAGCRPGQSFGFLPNAVWVDRGCHGYFSVTIQQ